MKCRILLHSGQLPKSKVSFVRLDYWSLLPLFQPVEVRVLTQFSLFHSFSFFLNFCMAFFLLCFPRAIHRVHPPIIRFENNIHRDSHAYYGYVEPFECPHNRYTKSHNKNRPSVHHNHRRRMVVSYTVSDNDIAYW